MNNYDLSLYSNYDKKCTPLLTTPIEYVKRGEWVEKLIKATITRTLKARIEELQRRQRKEYMIIAISIQGHKYFPNVPRSSQYSICKLEGRFWSIFDSYVHQTKEKPSRNVIFNSFFLLAEHFIFLPPKDILHDILISEHTEKELV